MQISTQQAINQAIAQFGGSLPTFIAVLLTWMNSNGRIGDSNSRIGELNQTIRDFKAETNAKFVDSKNEIALMKKELIDAIRSESQQTRDILRAELRRVGEVMDARLKHLEEREH